MDLLTRASKLAISPLPVPTGWYAIPLRLIVGFGFMQHGYAKLARGLEDFINILHAIGAPGAFCLAGRPFLSKSSEDSLSSSGRLFL